MIVEITLINNDRVSHIASDIKYAKGHFMIATIEANGTSQLEVYKESKIKEFTVARRVR